MLIHIKIFVGKSEFKSFDPQNVDYNPATGVMVITVGPDHGITTAHSVYINPLSMCFTCAQDGHGTDHFYPRPNGEWWCYLVMIQHIKMLLL